MKGHGEGRGAYSVLSSDVLEWYVFPGFYVYMRTSYLAIVVNKIFASSVTVAQAIYELITCDRLSKNFVNRDASLATRFAFSCQDPCIVIDMRKLNARPKSNLFDEFWGVMANMVEGRVSDRMHGVLLILDDLIFMVEVIASLLLLMPMLLHFQFIDDACNTQCMPVATCIANLIQKTAVALEIKHAPKTL